MLKNKIEVIQKNGCSVNTINWVRYPKSVVKEKVANRVMNSNLDNYNSKWTTVVFNKNVSRKKYK